MLHPATSAILAGYQARLDEIQGALSFAASRQTLASMLAAAALLACLTLAWMALARRSFPVWYSPLPLPVAAVCAGERSRRAAARLRLDRLSRFYTRGIARLRGEWEGAGDAGGEYAEENASHVYARDLNLFGGGSLFERLSLARTEVGRRRLAGLLLEQAPSVAECRARQEAVRELAQHGPSVREALAAMGEEYERAHAATFSQWLARAAVPFPAWTRWAAAGLGGAMALCLAVAVTTGLGPVLVPYAAAMAACEAALGLSLRRRVRSVIENSPVLRVELRLVREGMEWLAAQGAGFAAPRLATLAAQVQAAGPAIRRLERILGVLDQRTKDWFYSPSLLLMAGTLGAMAAEGWRARHGEALARWLDAWGEFEALHSLACYAHENPEDCFPEFAEGEAETVFDAEALGHPLLDAPACVRNDVRLAPGAVTIVSGSNMAGKSTLLRSIGVAAVLASAGAPVRARRLRLSPMALCASLSISDALREGKSKFLAEVERLREAIRLASGTGRALYLIDEIFSGTNSRDRLLAAQAVVCTLVAAGAIGVVSTHDLALTGMTGPGLNVVNVHMGARAGSPDPLDFDYLLKPGVTTESSALAIARLAGVPL